jgi:hypothetical protein
MTLFGAAAGLTGATMLVDILMQVFSLLLFVIVGLGFLALDGANDALGGSMAAGVSIMGIAIAGFFFAQRFGARLNNRALMALAQKFGWSSLADLASLHDNLMRIYADVPRFVAALVIHLGFWFVGALEVMVALDLMGYPASYGDAVVIESLGQALRGRLPGAGRARRAGGRLHRGLRGFTAFRRLQRSRSRWSNACRSWC